MNINIRLTTLADCTAVMSLFDAARRTMAGLGIDQWQNGYPFLSDIEADIAAGESYVATENGRIIGTFMLMKRAEPTYATVYDGNWLTPAEIPYATVHRITVAPDCRASARGKDKSGSVSAQMMAFIKDYALRAELGGGVKVDTHEGNIAMRRMLEKQGFIHCGVILLADGQKRVAYQWLPERHTEV